MAEVEHEYKIGNDKITFTVCSSRKGKPKIFDDWCVDVALFIEVSHPELYKELIEVLIEEEQQEQEELTYLGYVDEDAWKGYD